MMVTVVGAGFSGLTLAYHLRQRGLPVRVIEAQSRAGGMINTHATPQGFIETAANALLADAEIEKLCQALNVPLAERKPERKNRYIYWDRPRRWPLTTLTSLKALSLAAQVKWNDEHARPRDGETIYDWSRRVINAEFEERLLTPALQGVYAGDPKRLSAKLTLGFLFGPRAPRGRWRGSIAPNGGMNQLIQALRQRLEGDGVEFRFEQNFKLSQTPQEPVVVCTSAWAAAEIVSDPGLSEQLRHCESLPLVSVTAFFEKSGEDLRGFGCLFPRAQNFHATGVVFNDCVFAERSSFRSETWIFGGAHRLAAATWSDAELLEYLRKDRTRFQNDQSPVEYRVSRWPRAIPHYTVQWEKFLRELHAKPPLYLHGNYLGVIGLSRIHRRSIELAAELGAKYGS